MSDEMFLAKKLDPNTMMYGPYPSEMKDEIMEDCALTYTSGISALDTLWKWKERLLNNAEK